MSGRKRTEQFHVFLSPEEKVILEAKFKASGMHSRSSFIRHMILQGYVYDVDYSALRKSNEQLSKIGTNINQIARRVNSTGYIFPEEIKNIQEQLKDIWDIQKSILSRQPLGHQ